MQEGVRIKIQNHSIGDIKIKAGRRYRKPSDA